ncbi:MlaD family protein [Myxosarcina sp. GI1]|uniref:MlaD family protein n=1 Tax=Myxosarcina sp. GI1 TaxID=1541065 RepID=UPI000907835F|nr:MlaD family protein [Myxosarcina sp. GI1]
MRSRTVREGSVGLLIIVGVALVAGIALWLRGIKFGSRSYQIQVEFPDVNGIQVGDGVRYRGLRVGKIANIQSGTNGVDVTLEISSSDLVIPRDVNVKATSSGLIGETFIDIIPETQLSADQLELNPVGNNCNANAILCNNARLPGEKGLTLDDLLPLTYRFSQLYGDPEFFAKIDSVVVNASRAAAGVADLSQDVSLLVKDVERELAGVSQITNNLSDIANNTSSELVTTAQKYQTTADRVSELTTNVNRLLEQNQGNLTTTLNSISTTSDRLQGLIVKLDNTLGTTDTEQLAQNLETLTANAAAASENLKNISETFNDPNSLVTLQQTLDSARVTFANAQKITSDLEAFTGDPAFLENVRNLVNGLSNLVSSADRLERQIETRATISSASAQGAITPRVPPKAIAPINETLSFSKFQPESTTNFSFDKNKHQSNEFWQEK